MHQLPHEASDKIYYQISNRELSIPVPWGFTAAKTWGDSCLNPVLVVHGSQDNAGSFDRLLPLLPNSFYYVCVDLPGHGRSSKYPDGIRLDLMVFINAINRVIRHLQWSKFTYIGHSLGGLLGVYYAAMYPTQVMKLIVIDSAMPKVTSLCKYLEFHVNETEELIELEKKISNSAPPTYTYDEALQRMIERRSLPIKKEAAEALIQRSLKSGPNGYYFSTDQRLKLGVLAPISLEQHLHNMSLIQCPHLLILSKFLHSYIESELDDDLGKKTIEVFKKNKNFELVLVDGYHDVHNNEPHAVAPHISRFLIRQKSAL